MKARRFVLTLLIASMALLVLAACKSHPTTRLLFIGNSYTYVNGGVDQQLQALAPLSESSRIAVGGYTLEEHWEDGNALRTIRAGGWQYVILQEQSQTPVFDRDKFFAFAREFDGEIKRSGGKTILFMTWQRPDSMASGVTTQNLAAAYNELGRELGVRVAPVGLAFARSLRERPDLVLYSQDGHPTNYGTYLAACVLYRTIFATSLVGNSYSDGSITAEERAYFQRVAEERE